MILTIVVSLEILTSMVKINWTIDSRQMLSAKTQLNESPRYSRVAVAVIAKLNTTQILAMFSTSRLEGRSKSKSTTKSTFNIQALTYST